MEKEINEISSQSIFKIMKQLIYGYRLMTNLNKNVKFVNPSNILIRDLNNQKHVVIADYGL